MRGSRAWRAARRSGIRIYAGVLELQLAGPAHGMPNPVRGGNRCKAAAAGHPTQRGQPRLALDQRQRADIVAVEKQKAEDEETNPAALPASDHAVGRDRPGARPSTATSAA